MKREAKSAVNLAFTMSKNTPVVKFFLSLLPFLPLLLLLLICLFLLRPLYHPWFPRLSDGEYYLARLGNYFVALEHGQILPRWAPTFKFGFGYPVFNFNYPLPNIIGAFFIFLGFSIQTSMKFIFGLSLIGAGLGMYFYLKKHFKSFASFIGAFLYITAPYFTYDMFLRGTYGELVAFALFPYTLFSIENYLIKQNKQRFLVLVIFSTALLLSHNIMAVFSTVLILFYLVLNYRLSSLKSLISPLILVFFLISFFWIPALHETKYTVMADRALYQLFLTKLKTFSELTKLPPFLPNKPSLEHMRQVGYSQIFSYLLALFIIFKSKIKSRLALSFLIATTFSFALITKQSQFFWKLIPFAYIFQHPFRLLFITTISTSILGAWVVSVSKSKFIAASIILLTVLTYYLYYALPTDYVPYDDNFLKNYPLTSTAADEFDPPWYDKTESDKFLDNSNSHYFIATGSAKIIKSNSDYFNRTAIINSEQDSIIVEKTLYFPGWEVSIDNQKSDIEATKYNYGGLINYTVPPGTHTITTKFTQNTPARITGNSLTILGILLLIVKVIVPNSKPLGNKT